MVLRRKGAQTVIYTITEGKVTEIFCLAGDFRKFFDTMMARYTIRKSKKRGYHRNSTLSKAEVMLIMILFHDSGYRCLKHFYLDEVCKHLRHLFPRVVSYNRFARAGEGGCHTACLVHKEGPARQARRHQLRGQHPSLRVRKNQRILIHKTFKGIARRGKCSMGWLFGFKLHLICNERGKLLNFMITPGDVDDRKPLEYKAFVELTYGKLVGDKGDISKKLLERLFVDGIQLITKLKSNMKGALMNVSDRVSLRKRAIIETVNDELKNIAQIGHSRHRAFHNFVVNLLSGIATYCLFPKKPIVSSSKKCNFVNRMIRSKWPWAA